MPLHVELVIIVFVSYDTLHLNILPLKYATKIFLEQILDLKIRSRILIFFPLNSEKKNIFGKIFEKINHSLLLGSLMLFYINFHKIFNMLVHIEIVITVPYSITYAKLKSQLNTAFMMKL